MRTFFDVRIESAKTLLSNFKDSQKLSENYMYKTVELATVFPIFKRVKFYLDQDTSEVKLEKESCHHSYGPSILVTEEENGLIKLKFGYYGLSGLDKKDNTPETITKLASYFLESIDEIVGNGLTRTSDFISLVNPDYQGDDMYIMPHGIDSENIYNCNHCLIKYYYSFGPKLVMHGGNNPKDLLKAYIFAQRSKLEMPILNIYFENTEIHIGHEFSDGTFQIVSASDSIPLELEERLFRDFRQCRKLEK